MTEGAVVELGKRLDDTRALVMEMSKNFAMLSASVAQLSATNASIAAELQRAHTERLKLTESLNEIREQLAEQRGIGTVAKWLFGVGTTVIGAITGAASAIWFGRGS